ncbi:hypothetical protein R1sor_001291 [Riccia sorocarpa]|uniref:non-specific serine/threonine protein kinase n=1 Tax=Riccia sorocarpa TaxID=122646 RepID=A0ABD3H1I7_9MARC
MLLRAGRAAKPEQWRRMTFFSDGNGLVLVAALVAFWIGCCIQPAAAQTNDRDLAALQALAKAWSGSNALSSWIGTDPCGELWAGITCDSDGNVTQLELTNRNISGSIPPDIGNLVALESLDLTLNRELVGKLPPELGNLTNLKQLSIQQCSISGSIPQELSNLLQLEFLAVNDNQMVGNIPAQIGRLSKLYWFDISQNQIAGSLPVSSGKDGIGLDNLTSIKHLHFNNNSLGGSIPPEIFKLPNLIHLLLDSNSFIDTIPNNSSSSILILRLDNNRLTGPIPSVWSNMTSVVEIHINNNQLSGTLPDWSNLTNLRLLDTSNNPLLDSQPIPDFLAAGMANLQTLSMSGCNLEGRVPPGLFSNPSLQRIELSDNKLNGTLTFGQIGKNLQYVDLEQNNINNIDAASANGVDIDTLLLGGNPVCNSTFLKVDQFCVADSGSTSSYPQLPFCGGKNCTGGQVLHGGSCICGDAAVCQMRLNSPPYRVINQDIMTQLIKDLAFLFSEEASNDENLARVRNQVFLDPHQLWIESANITGNSRLNFTLAIFPLSGREWTRQEVNYIVTFFYNNTVHLPKTQGPYSILGYTDPVYGLLSSKSSLGTGALIGIIVAGVVVALVLALIGFYAWRQKRRADQAEVMTRPFASWGAKSGKDDGAAPKLQGARYFSLNDVKKATGNFAERNVVGVGGYGKVYRGTLADGEVVAIKRAQEGSMQGKDEFKNEIELLSRVHHKNLVSLLGFCYDKDHNEQMLIYQYMPNGTLRDHLLGRTEDPLTWQTRLNIALGSAKGLAYLHEMANPPVIHRDIKSTNILLDDKWVAKVADFGLSKTAPPEGSKGHVSTQVKGTLGYLDPEYYMTQQLTEKSDVYSFGVVLLELLTARAPIENNRYIVREVRDTLERGGVAALRSMLDRHIRDCPANELEDFLQLALHCVEEAAKNRPNMDEVVKELERVCGHSLSSSVGIGASGHAKDLYSDDNFLGRSKEPQFQYSGGYTVPTEIQPK